MIRSIIVLFLLSPVALRAQQASVTIRAQLDKNQILLGEHSHVVVELQVPADRLIGTWYNLPDSFNHLEVLSRSPIDSTIASLRSYRQTITITGFDSGKWTIPAFTVRVNGRRFSSDSLFLLVLPSNTGDTTYHDIREIIAVEAVSNDRWYWIAGAVSLVILGMLAYLWWRGKKKPETFAATRTTSTPLEEALRALATLDGKQLIEKGEVKEYYSGLTNVFKVFVTRKLSTPAMHATTSDLLLMTGNSLEKEQMARLAETLRMADAAKFAKYIPGADDATVSRQTTERSIRLLDETIK